MRQVDEHELLERCRKGDRGAFGLVIERYQARVFSLVRRVVGQKEAAEDLTQEAFLRAFVYIGRFDPGRPFLPWIFRIAVNLARNWFKASARRESPTGADEGHLALVVEDLPRDPAESSAELEAALMKLPAKYRVVLVLKHVEELSYREIRHILRLPVTTLKMRVSRARVMLRRQLEAAQRKEER